MILSLAGLNIEVKNRFDYIEQQARDYISDSENIDFSVEASDADITAEAEMSEESFSRGYLESIAIYRKIAERLPEYGAVVFHGAVISDGEEAYAVTARSGVGKTTHLRLWLEEFGDSVHILNGDKPILRVIDGAVYAAGTPWRGKEGYGVPEVRRLSAIGFLERDALPSARAMTSAESLLRLASQTYIPKSPATASLALRVLDCVMRSVRLYEIRANMSRESARVSYKVFKNNK